MNPRSFLTTALVVGLALPAFAQDGFRVGVQLGSMKTTGPEAKVASTYNPDPFGGETVNFDQPTQSPLSLDLAWVKGDDEWSLTYFTTKKKTSKTVMDAANGVVLGNFPFGVADAGLAGSRELKATLIDLDWKHAFVKGEKASLALSAGLRYSQQSDERTYQQLNAAGTPDPGSLHMKGKGTGFGLSTGLHVRYSFSDRAWLTSGYKVILLNNTSKSEDYTATALFGPGLSSPSSPDNHETLVQSDAYLRFNMNFVATFNGYLGYEVRDFNKDAARIQNNLTNFSLPATSGFGLSGFTLGLSYTF
ncbi:MAG: hypothetical protein JST24_09990 [Acidobacteria bacterium]|nr:hypothetical protein [Acidobacteriota bacterium]